VVKGWADRRPCYSRPTPANAESTERHARAAATPVTSVARPPGNPATAGSGAALELLQGGSEQLETAQGRGVEDLLRLPREVLLLAGGAGGGVDRDEDGAHGLALLPVGPADPGDPDGAVCAEQAGGAPGHRPRASGTDDRPGPDPQGVLLRLD